MNRDLERLLLHKEFDQLTASERNFVLSYVEEADYSEYRRLLINSRNDFKSKLDRLPEPQIDQGLVKKALRAREQNPQRFMFFPRYLLKHFNSHKYGYLAIFVFLSTGLFMFFSSLINNDKDPDIATIYLYEARELESLQTTTNPNKSVEVTNSYLLNNDSLFKALDKMNNHLIIETQGLNVEIMIPYQE